MRTVQLIAFASLMFAALPVLALPIGPSSADAVDAAAIPRPRHVQKRGGKSDKAVGRPRGGIMTPVNTRQRGLADADIKKLAQKKLAQEQLAQEKLAQEKLAQEKLAQEKLAQNNERMKTYKDAKQRFEHLNSKGVEVTTTQDMAALGEADAAQKSAFKAFDFSSMHKMLQGELADIVAKHPTSTLALDGLEQLH